MKLSIVICSFVMVVVGQEPSLSCRYTNLHDVYQCEVLIDNPNGFDNFTEIGGIHLEGFTNADVRQVEIFQGNTRNIPQIICNTFPNVDAAAFMFSQISEIDDNALSGCTKLRMLWLRNNRISSISENAFVNLRETTYINLGHNLLTTLPENTFASQQSLTQLKLYNNPLAVLPAGVFRPLEALQLLSMNNANLTALNGEWFTPNSNLEHLLLRGNRIVLSAASFSGMQHVRHLYLENNGITEIPPETFAGLTNIISIELNRNNIAVLRANTFTDLDHLSMLFIDENPIETIDDEAFQGLDSLIVLHLANCRIRDLTSKSFAGLSNLTRIDLSFNSIEELPPGTLTGMLNLSFVGLRNNRLNTLRRNVFGTLTLTSLRTLVLEGNILNALDRTLIDDATNLEALRFNGNLCASNSFESFVSLRQTYLPMLETCFRNIRYTVETTTESNGIYSFFEAPQPGIVVRVRSDNEVQIVLSPNNFIETTAIEIFIGSINNTQSEIRINENTNVVTVSTPNILEQNQWNDFRLTWAKSNILVFIGNETFPFMSYVMQQLFPVNFYGLRAVESRALWTLQPFDP